MDDDEVDDEGEGGEGFDLGQPQVEDNPEDGEWEDADEMDEDEEGEGLEEEGEEEEPAPRK